MKIHSASIPKEWDISVKSDGITTVVTASFVTLYLQGCHVREMRQRIATIVHDYLVRWEEYINWSRHPKSSRWYGSHSKRLPKLEVWLDELDEDVSWDFSYHGGEGPESASPYLIEGFGCPKWQGGFGFIRVALPSEVSVTTPNVFFSYIEKLCNTLQPWHGYGGLGFIESPEITVKQAFESQVTVMADRFSGIEVDVPLFHLNHLANAVKGINWLTILADFWLDFIAGWEELDKGEPTVSVHRYSGGIILQAGAHPSPGDLNRESLPPSYIRVSKLIKPIRVKNHPSFHMAGGHPRMDDEHVRQWICRFD